MQFSARRSLRISISHLNYQGCGAEKVTNTSNGNASDHATLNPLKVPRFARARRVGRTIFFLMGLDLLHISLSVALLKNQPNLPRHSKTLGSKTSGCLRSKALRRIFDLCHYKPSLFNANKSPVSSNFQGVYQIHNRRIINVATNPNQHACPGFRNNTKQAAISLRPEPLLARSYLTSASGSVQSEYRTAHLPR
ncbi:hypothetical protein ROLI_006430 [Roseobacter fucihabitans]|uniref:Uncharacterized protein n=1 Tax=Roseobacter fucihabitans TaxID=1537242 RepID=A0ABZ2BNH5_9RHOB|nr:hypothetical protein [Roseobacter litoralis]